MVGRRTAAVTGLAALLLTGASLLVPTGSEASTRASASNGTSVGAGQDHHRGPHADKLDELDELDKLDKHGKDDGESEAPSPGADSTDNNSGTIGGTPAPVTGQSSGEPSVGGAQATTNGADGNEALAASAAPTPPNGAEPPAATSPGVADTSPVATDAPVVDAPTGVATDEAAPAPVPPAPDGGLLDDLAGVIGATGPKPVAAGLSPDTTRPGVLVALLAFAVLLFLVGYQLVDRRDPRRDTTRDAEAIARFR